MYFVFQGFEYDSSFRRNTGFTFMYRRACGVCALVSLIPFSAFAERYAIKAPGYAFAPSPTAGNAGFLTGASFSSGAARINAAVPVFGKTMSIPFTVKAAGDAAKYLGAAFRVAGPAGVGVAAAAWLAAEAGIFGSGGEWMKKNPSWSTALNGCWAIYDRCVANPSTVINEQIEAVNATFPDVRGDYQRFRLLSSKTVNLTVGSNPLKRQVFTLEEKLCKWLTCYVANVWDVNADFAPSPAPPYNIPATAADFPTGGAVPDAVLSEASARGTPIPVQAPVLEWDGWGKIMGQPYTPTGSVAPVVPVANLTSTVPGYVDVTYTTATPVTDTGGGTTTTGTAPGTTTGTTTSGGTTTVVQGSTTITNNNQQTTTTTTTNNITNNYTRDASTPQELDIPDLCKDNPNALACQEMGEAEDEEVTKENKEFSYTPFNLGLPSGCPSPRLVSGNVYLEYPCDAAKTARPIVVALGAVASLMIMFAAVRS